MQKANLCKRLNTPMLILYLRATCKTWALPLAFVYFCKTRKKALGMA